MIDWAELKFSDVQRVHARYHDFSISKTEANNINEIINAGEKGMYGEHEISYTAEIYTNKHGREVFKINFDKEYPKSEIHTMRINLPSDY